jgi:hypothetical protein
VAACRTLAATILCTLFSQFAARALVSFDSALIQFVRNTMRLRSRRLSLRRWIAVATAILCLLASAHSARCQDLDGFAYQSGSMSSNPGGQNYFSTPSVQLSGFRDSLNYLASATVGTQSGPVIYVGNYGNINAPIQNSNSTTFTLFRVADDINEHGIPGSVAVVDPATGLLTTITDFGDLHEFNVAFTSMTFGQIVGSYALDVVNVVWLGDDKAYGKNETVVGLPNGSDTLLASYWRQRGLDARNLGPYGAPTRDSIPLPNVTIETPFSKRPSGIGLIYGARAIRRYDEIDIRGVGGILDESYWNTSTDNQVFGPQAGLVWAHNRGPWSMQVQGTVMAAVDSGDIDQYGGIGRGLIPGALNRPAFAQPTYFSHHVDHNTLSPSGELRAQASVQITSSISAKAAWARAIVLNTVTSNDRIDYQLPDLGIADTGNQNFYFGTMFCGVEMVR